MIKCTRAQRESLFRLFRREFPGWVTPTLRVARPLMYAREFSVQEWKAIAAKQPDSFIKVPSIQYRKFLKKCQPEFCSHGAIMVPTARMWIGVERDGYAHS